jgi:hypothetical protein
MSPFFRQWRWRETSSLEARESSAEGRMSLIFLDVSSSRVYP